MGIEIKLEYIEANASPWSTDLTHICQRVNLLQNRKTHALVINMEGFFIVPKYGLIYQVS